MKLNELQQEAYNEVLYGDQKVVVLTAPAGCGKTYVTSQIIKDFKGSITITATTNRAKQVLANMSESTASTIQSAMGFIMARQGKEQFLTKNRNKKIAKADLIIVEEISMLPRAVYQEILLQLKNNKAKKVLMLGDDVQLPTIGLGVDIPSIEGKHIRLTEQMRQDADPVIQKYFDQFREAILNKSNSFVPSTDAPDNIVFTENHTEFCKAYNKAEGVKKIVAFTNATVGSYNKHIHGGTIRKGDEVVIDKPLGLCSNGDTVMVSKVTEHTDYLEIVVIANGQKVKTRSYKTKQALEAYLNSSKSTDVFWERNDKCHNYKHQYACTTFKSQGSTYDHVFVDGTDIWGQHIKKASKYNNWAKPISYELFLRHLYVAISRMSKSATIFVGSSRTYRGLK